MFYFKNTKLLSMFFLTFFTLIYCDKQHPSRLRATQEKQFNWEETIKSLGSDLKVNPDKLAEEVKNISEMRIQELGGSTTIEAFLKRWLTIDKFKKEIENSFGKLNLKRIEIKLNYPLKRVPVLPFVVLMALKKAAPDELWLSEEQIKDFLSKLRRVYKKIFSESDYQDYRRFEKFTNEMTREMTETYMDLWVKTVELNDRYN
jgi:murein L,D-transpeptidase YcbB/YkuD